MLSEETLKRVRHIIDEHIRCNEALFLCSSSIETPAELATLNYRHFC